MGHSGRVALSLDLAEARPMAMILTDALVVITCCRCGVPFGIPQYLERARRQDEQMFHCPNGHEQFFPLGKTIEQQLREKVDNLAAARDAEYQQRVAAQAEVTRLQKREKRASPSIRWCVSLLPSVLSRDGSTHGGQASGLCEMSFCYRGQPEWLRAGDRFTNGAARVPGLFRELTLIFSDGEGWEHVSVSTAGRCPNWDEMCFVKALFWSPEDVVIQFHPPASAYVNKHPYCLHLWRQPGVALALPPTWMIG
jgi:hypothetical protein